jgi:hypothetical protein
MTAPALEEKGDTQGSHWARRVVLVTFSLGLLAMVAAVFTRVIAARVPEQRATLEKLIADRTGLAVRFDNVRFAWGLDGTSAVFERVELTDPVHGRVRVVAPELRVEFDAWDFLKNQQFSLGHVKLASPDIEIIGDPEPTAGLDSRARRTKDSPPETRGELDDALSIRRFTTWAELMPVGRVEVEGARVHLLRRGDVAPRHSFTLSQAQISRGSNGLNAFGTLLLSQDVGQSLFVSTKLENLGASKGASGELRLIARRVLLDKLDAALSRGRGTLDAKLQLLDGHVHRGSWQASARELEFANGGRFDHFTVHGALSREGKALRVELTDLQVSRGARLERAPRLSAHVTLAPGSLELTHLSLQAPRLSFMAAELVAGAIAWPVNGTGMPQDWIATAGELREVDYDSDGVLRAQLAGGEFTRGSDRARIGHLAAALELREGELTVAFDPTNPAMVWLEGVDPRTWRLAGTLAVRELTAMPHFRFDAVELSSGESALGASGFWGAGQFPAKPLSITATRVNRALLGDVHRLLALGAALPRIEEVEEGTIATGQLQLLPVLVDGERQVDWRRSSGSLMLVDLDWSGESSPRLADAAGKLDFSRGNTQLRLTGGKIDDLQLESARLEWPRQGEPRLQASLRGNLDSKFLGPLLSDQGLGMLGGDISLDVEARGEASFRDPKRWRAAGRVDGASILLAPNLPPAQQVSGSLRLADGQLRGLALEATWLGGPVKLESRRSGARARLIADVSGSTDAPALLRLLGQSDAADLVEGQLGWNGTLSREQDSWLLTMNSHLVGIESRLPEPLGKTRARQLPVRAELRLSQAGVREFTITSARDVVRGHVEDGVTVADFEVQGIAGEWRAAPHAAGNASLVLEQIELRRTPVVLAAAGSLLPVDAEADVRIGEIRHARRPLGSIQAGLRRRAGLVEFNLESAPGARHDLNATGACSADTRRCDLDFTFETPELKDLLAVDDLPREWPMRSLRATGELAWPSDVVTEPLRHLSGRVDIETRGSVSTHQLAATAVLAAGEIELVNVQGMGPDADQVFQGNGRIGIAARTYDLTVDYERVSLAATAVPSPARAGLARAWSVLRGTADRRAWTDGAPARRVQWHGTWDGEAPAPVEPPR